MSIPEFKLDAFEGPLDLLLHLIAKHKLNIYDIEISLLLDQYLEYIEGLEEQDFDAAGDFLAMAARLVYIKTCSLLPQPEEAEEMKKELQGELLDYSECKAAAARLLRLSVYGDVFVRPPEKLPVNKVFTGTISPDKLVEAYLGMNAKTRNLKPVRAEQFSPLVRSRFVTVTSKIIHVLKRLLKTGECTVAELYVGVEDKSSRVATFLAVLELAKSGRISLNDDNTVISFNRSAPRRHDPNAKPAETKPKEQYTVPTVTIERAVPKEQYTVPTVTIERAAPKEQYTIPTVTIERNVPKEQYTVPTVTIERAVPKEQYTVPTVTIERTAPKEQYTAPTVTIERAVPKEQYTVPTVTIERAAPKEQYTIPTVTIERTAPKEQYTAPTVTVEQAEEKKPAVKNIALEAVSSRHSLAIPAFSLFIDEQPEMPAAAEKAMNIKQNRFGRRCRWGHPAEGNCWSYRRERL